jgi:hypothetical protein
MHPHIVAFLVAVSPSRFPEETLLIWNILCEIGQDFFSAAIFVFISRIHDAYMRAGLALDSPWFLDPVGSLHHPLSGGYTKGAFVAAGRRMVEQGVVCAASALLMAGLLRA